MLRTFIAILFFSISSASFAIEEHRLTLLPGTAKTDADIASATSVCIEPYKAPHNQLTTFDGANWVSADILPGTTCLSVTGAGLTVNTLYDVLASISSGFPTLSWSPPYSNDTTPPPRAIQDGMEVLAADHTKLIVGNVKVNGIGTLSDSHSCRCLSNYYRPEPREMWAQDPALTWTGGTTGYVGATAYQQAHGNPSNQLEYVSVVPRLIAAQVQAAVIISPSGGGAFVGIGLDGALGDVSNCGKQQASVPGSLSSVSFQTSSCYLGTPGKGRHTVQWLEHVYTGAPVWMGTVPPSQVSGISGVVMN